MFASVRLASTTLLLASLAAAQSFNIDLGVTSQPTPGPSYGAAAEQPGFWSFVLVSEPNTPVTALSDLLGQPTAVTFRATDCEHLVDGANLPGASVDDWALFADVLQPTPLLPPEYVTSVLTVAGLAEGTYSVFTYAMAPDEAVYRSDVAVDSSLDPLQTVGGAYPGAHTFVLGVTHALHRVVVQTGQSLVIRVARSPEPVPNWATVNGLQIVQWSNGTSFCAGDGLDGSHTTLCPCGNVGAVGRGCASSVNPLGALLEASGHTGFDDVVLLASGMPQTVASIFLQGDGLEDSVFGDGVRCTGGNLLRLRARMTNGGSSQFPNASDTVTLSQRAGVTLGSGAVRHYQVFYRNAAVTFCPSGASNVTNGRTIAW